MTPRTSRPDALERVGGGASDRGGYRRSTDDDAESTPDSIGDCPSGETVLPTIAPPGRERPEARIEGSGRVE